MPPEPAIKQADRRQILISFLGPGNYFLPKENTVRTKEDHFPSLPLGEWEETKNTLHLFMQVLGKIRLGAFPRQNHWWHATLYPSSRGLSTGAGPSRLVALPGMSVAEFYREVLSSLAAAGIQVEIHPVPYDMPAVSTTPFSEDNAHASYQKEYVVRYWRILNRVDGVFQEFRGRFVGKSSPVQLFWHHMDLALARFSGRATPYPNATPVNRDAYSHEMISFGFWAGDDRVRAPAFYSYTYPLPEGLYAETLRPREAFWSPEAGYALLRYEDLRSAASPEQTLLQFV